MGSEQTLCYHEWVGDIGPLYTNNARAGRVCIFIQIEKIPQSKQYARQQTASSTQSTVCLT